MTTSAADSIQASGWPLVFRVDTGADPAGDGTVEVAVRALDGMQKEALVDTDTGTWRMVSDEGPYLNGTDLAPFPLAFFTAGMQFSLLDELLRAGAAIDSVRLQCDNHYSMMGSFLRGDATGGAMPAHLRLSIESQASPARVAEAIGSAVAACAAQATMRNRLRNAFALQLGNAPVDIEQHPEAAAADDPAIRFAAIQPLPEADDIIVKTATAETVFGVTGGAGSSLAPEQKRTLHVRGRIEWRGGASASTEIQLLAPIGSTFRFRCALAAVPSPVIAPPALAYLGAGIGFCYMTQIGRYANISRQSIDSYRIVQRNTFRRTEAGQTTAESVHTNVFLDAPLSPDAAADIVRTGERTCFLHAAMRESHPSQIEADLNGTALQLETDPA